MRNMAIKKKLIKSNTYDRSIVGCLGTHLDRAPLLLRWTRAVGVAGEVTVGVVVAGARTGLEGGAGGINGRFFVALRFGVCVAVGVVVGGAVEVVRHVTGEVAGRVDISMRLWQPISLRRRLTQIEKLSAQERRQILQALDVLIERGQLKQKIRSTAESR